MDYSPVTKFIIFGLQRTGTSWIETLLDSHPDIRCFGEIFYFFHGRFPLRKARGRRTELSYRRNVESSRRNRLMHYISKKKLINATLDEIYSRPGYAAIGFKLMYDQAKQFPAVLEYAHNYNVKLIHVVRSNVLKTYISLFSAKQRSLVHTTKKVVVGKINLPTRLLLRKIKKIDYQNIYWEKFFKNCNLDYLKLEYESMLNNSSKNRKELLSFLMVNDKMDLTSNLRKINPNNLEDVISNYNQVRTYLTGTPYEWCLS